MNNKTYDVLKWVALVVLPALTTLWLTLANIWGFPYAEAIGATMAAITAFLGALLGVSSVQYNKKINSKSEE
ncbi:MAG: phage holin [Oscillospiraceae bacterium]|nr:phage holin [Oscillospiraceae bacterium]